MKIIDQYIIKELIPPFLLGLFIFTFAMLFNVFILMAELMIKAGVEFGHVAEMLYYSLPNILVLTLPIGLLIAVLMTFGRLSADNEITALKASGVSVMRLMVPVMVVAFICWLVTQYIVLVLKPQSTHEFNRIKHKIKTAQLSKIVKAHQFIEVGQLIFYTDEIDPDTGVMKRLFIHDDGESKRDSISIFARDGEQVRGADKFILNLKDGVNHSIPLKGKDKYIVDRFQKQVISLEEVNDTGSNSRSDRELGVREILNLVQKYKKANKPYANLLVELHKKFSIPFACLVFALIGVPLGVTTKRGGKSSGFAIALGLIILYYIFLQGGEAMGDKNFIPPFFAMWAPNIFLILLGVYLLVKLVKESPYKLAGWFWEKLKKVFLFIYRILVPARNHEKLFPKTRNEARQRQVMFSFGFPKILDKYIMQEFIKYFTFIIITFVLIALITKAFEDLKHFLKHHAQLIDVIQYFFYMIPYFSFFAIQVAVLVATILVINKFSRTSEMTAMLASGISLYRIAFPIVLIAFFISCISFVFNEYVIPGANRKAEFIMNKIKRKDQGRITLHNAVWRKGNHNQIYYYLAFNKKSNVIINLILFQLDNNGVPLKRYEATTVRWVQESKEKITGKGQWVMDSGRIIVFGENVQEQKFNNLPLDLDEKPEELRREQKKSKVMNYNELKKYVRTLRRAGYTTAELEVDLHAKISLPFISFIIAIVGIPFAVQSARTGTMAGIGISIFIGFGYVLIFSIIKALGMANILPPFFAAWGANMFFLMLGLYFLTGART